MYYIRTHVVKFTYHNFLYSRIIFVDLDVLYQYTHCQGNSGREKLSVMSSSTAEDSWKSDRVNELP